MTENFFEKSFGLNVRFPSRTIQHSRETITKAVESLFNPFSDFFENNQKVFN